MQMSLPADIDRMSHDHHDDAVGQYNRYEVERKPGLAG